MSDFSKIKRDIRKIQDKYKKLLDDSFCQKEAPFYVAATGLYNGGKSSLLNALTGSFDNSRFKVADKRETICEQEVCIDDIVYIDTPGLNAAQDDDKNALDSVGRINLNLFVHNINHGDLTQPELQYIKSLMQSSFGASGGGGIKSLL